MAYIATDPGTDRSIVDNDGTRQGSREANALATRIGEITRPPVASPPHVEAAPLVPAMAVEAIAGMEDTSATAEEMRVDEPGDTVWEDSPTACFRASFASVLDLGR